MRGRFATDTPQCIHTALTGQSQSAVKHAATVRALGKPHCVQTAFAVGCQRRAVMRANIHRPLVKRRAAHGAHAAIRVHHAQRVVAHIGLEHMAPQSQHAAVVARQHGDTATLATVIRKFKVAAKCRALIVRHRVIDRCALIVRGLARGHHVALVNPSNEQPAVARHRQRIETMGDFLTVAVYGQRRAKRFTAVERTREAYVTGVRLGQRLGPGDIHFALGTERDFRPCIAFGADAFGRGIHRLRHRPAFACVSRAAQHDVATLLAHRPQHALRIKRRRRRQLYTFSARGIRAVPRVLRVRTCPHEQQETQHRHAIHHFASNPAYSVRGNPGDNTG